ncbi:MAG TPA: potassium transporter TrkG, partial [Bacteroidales bacterium]|nr:potassium transporter TrkG [Bacteroidales bacterium]
ALEDLISIRSIRERIRNPWKRISVNTKIVLFTSLALILFGAVMFYLFEKNNTLKGMGLFETIVTCLFQSITPRTAGFNTVDFSHLLTPTLLILMFLMFIGASPGSTGGGIKTTTFAVIVKSALATISGKKTIEFFRQSIREESVGKAYAIVLFSMSLIFISTLLLTITEPDKSFLQLAFEEISAFGTVGLSTGITPLLSEVGKIIIIFTMFVGRIGTLTLALIFSRKVLYTKYKYATTYLQIG